MPLFEISNNKLLPAEQKNFTLEKELQTLIEENLKETFNCRFVASEFSTGAQHAGRIDSLALSEENNPVIIEYKKVESSGLINQSLFYLHWIQDHKGDFEIAVQKNLGKDARVDWSDIRVICIAPNYKKYDLHAVQVMGANIELWRYRLFSNNSLYLEEILYPSKSASTISSLNKQSVVLEADKKAATVRVMPTYSIEEHFKGKSEEMLGLMHYIREFIVGLDAAIEEVPKKFYIAYKSSQNIVCMEGKSRHVKLWVKLKPTDVQKPLKIYRDVSQIGHFGTGDVEFTVSTQAEFDDVKEYIKLAYNKVGA